MILKTFILNFVTPNTLIRLWYPSTNGNYTPADKLEMSWRLMKDINYSELEVIGVTDIFVNDGYSEAVNIVVERMTIDKAREIKLNSLMGDGRI
jgi:hypothetical protein